MTAPASASATDNKTNASDQVPITMFVEGGHIYGVSIRDAGVDSDDEGDDDYDDVDDAKFEREKAKVEKALQGRNGPRKKKKFISVEESRKNEQEFLKSSRMSRLADQERAKNKGSTSQDGHVKPLRSILKRPGQPKQANKTKKVDFDFDTILYYIEPLLERTEALSKSMAITHQQGKHLAQIPGGTTLTTGLVFSQSCDAFQAAPSLTTFAGVLYAMPWAAVVPQAYLTQVSRIVWEQLTPEIIKDWTEQDQGQIANAFIYLGYFLMLCEMRSLSIDDIKDHASHFFSKMKEYRNSPGTLLKEIAITILTPVAHVGMAACTSLNLIERFVTMLNCTQI